MILRKNGFHWRTYFLALIPFPKKIIWMEMNPVLNTKPFTDPEPLPVPLTTKSRTRRRGSMTLTDVVPPSLRKSRIKKYPTPPIYYADDDDESGDETSSSQASSSSTSAGDYDNSENESSDRGNGGGGGGAAPLQGGVKGDPDSSYVFGYETEHSNRLEKADPYGNVRGSYSYIGSSINQLLSRHHSPSSSGSHRHYRRHVVDEPMRKPILLRRTPFPVKKSERKRKKSLKSIVDPEGVKRTVHYIAGGNTGFQVIHASPSISRGVRLEAPPGYVVKRVPSLRTSESRFPIPISVPQPSAIVYHIHPDSGWKPWEPTLRKKKIKIHRKKLPKAVFENARRDGIVLLQTHPDPPVAPSNNKPAINTFGGDATSPVASPSQGNINLATLGVSAGNPATGAYFKEKITTAGSGTVTATETKLPPPPVPSRRRHAPQRGYTAEHHIVQIDDDDSKEHVSASQYVNHHKHHSKSSTKSSSSSSSQTSQSKQQSSSQNVGGGSGGSSGVHEREPLLYSPTFESMRDSRMPIPNPIQLQPTQVAIRNRGAPSQTATGAPSLIAESSSNHHPVAFSSDGKQVDVPTVIIEAIEANKSPSSSLVPQQQQKKDESRNVVLQQNLPESASLQKTPSSSSSSSSGQLSGSTISFVQVSTPTYTSSPSSPQATYQPSSISAPTPPVNSSPSSSSSSPQQQKTHHHQPQQQQQQHSPSNSNNQISPVQQQPAPPSQSRSRRRHHRSKSAAGGTTPTSPSSSSSSSSGNAIQSGASKIETTTMMSSSKRLMNRLAASDRDETLSAQQ